MTLPAPLLEARALSIRTPSAALVECLELVVNPGDFIAILGRNGSGKTLTLHTLAALRPAQGGLVLASGKALSTLPRRDIARRIALVPQDLEVTPELSALESVLLARYAQHSIWSAGGSIDVAHAKASLERLGAASLGGRKLGSLSGGEQRRVAAAAALAQGAAVVLLDEPTNHLDPNHALSVLDAFRDHAAQGGAVIASLHDPTLAARCATRVLLLWGDGHWQLGATAEVLNEAVLSELYLTPIIELRTPTRRVFAPR